MILLLLALLCLMPATGAAETYLNLIATADGNTVFVQVRNRFDATNWFRVDAAGTSITASAIEDRVADIK